MVPTFSPLGVVQKLAGLRDVWELMKNDPTPVGKALTYAWLGQFQQTAAPAITNVYAFAVQARDARTSADRRAALDALERAALALGGTP